jgi:hypothetical protein
MSKEETTALPSDLIKKYPFESVFGKSEYETIALNIMRILERKGNTWRKLSYEEYETERLKDSNYSKQEEMYLEQVLKYTENPTMAAKFSTEWKKVVVAKEQNQ